MCIVDPGHRRIPADLISPISRKYRIRKSMQSNGSSIKKIRENIALDEKKIHSNFGGTISRCYDAVRRKIWWKSKNDHIWPYLLSRIVRGCHVSNTGKIGFFKISSESAIAARCSPVSKPSRPMRWKIHRRPEQTIGKIKALLKFLKICWLLFILIEEINHWKNQLTIFQEKEVASLKKAIDAGSEKNDINIIVSNLFDGRKDVQTLIPARERNRQCMDLFGLIGNGKPMIMLHISNNLVASKALNAMTTVKSLATHIQGGGGGQPFFCNSRW